MVLRSRASILRYPVIVFVWIEAETAGFPSSENPEMTDLSDPRRESQVIRSVMSGASHFDVGSRSTSLRHVRLRVELCRWVPRLKQVLAID